MASDLFQTIGSLSISALEEMPIGVICGPDGGVAEALRDHVWVLACCDEQGYVGVPEIVRPHRLAD